MLRGFSGQAFRVEVAVVSKESKTALNKGAPEGNGHQGKAIRGGVREGTKVDTLAGGGWGGTEELEGPVGEIKRGSIGNRCSLTRLDDPRGVGGLQVQTRHKFGQETTQKKHRVLFSKRSDAFFLDRGDAQICKFAHTLCNCEYSSQGG